MKQKTRSFEYEEEDGFEIQRGDKIYLLFGIATADYIAYYEPATRDDPGCDECEQDNLEVEVTGITDEDGNDVELELTADELASFESHMSSWLDDKASDNDAWED